MKKTKQSIGMKQPMDLLDILLDKDNREPIVLMDENGRQIAFEQVALIPYDVCNDRKLYVVLKPIDKVEGIADNEAVVFVCEQNEQGYTILRVEEDEKISIAVFAEYYKLLDN